MTEQYTRKLGLDLGAVRVKGVVLDEKGAMIASAVQSARGRPFVALGKLFESFSKHLAGHSVVAAMTGSGRYLLDPDLPVELINEIVALTCGSRVILPRVGSAIEMGGHSSRWVQMDSDASDQVGISDFSLNELCAAGSGAFLEQQCGRLKLSLDELSKLAVVAERGASIAGRCSVFAKSDMIHLQQKGTPLSEIAYGLCLAMARNFTGTVLRGRTSPSPVLLAGGCAANEGLVRAFRQLLGLNENELLPSTMPGLEGALGCAHLASEVLSDRNRAKPWTELEGLILASKRDEGSVAATSLQPLRIQHDAVEHEPKAPESGDIEAFLGVDVGSVSTNLALVSPNGDVLDGIYLPTRGRPVDVLAEAMGILKERCGDRLNVRAVGTTGSGRHLAAQLVGADVVRNEITCQLESALHYFPQVDTIFEIGGQDSKYIHVKDGRIADFKMNKICAAGTGSFLEEQADLLGISVYEDFAPLAGDAPNPCDLGTRCTVFMETDLVNAQTRGIDVKALVSGLAYSIARNYLEKVVAGGHIGDHVVFSGGVASNTAVVAAFENILNRSMCVHPFNRVAGAVGAALLAQREHVSGPTRFRGLDLPLPTKVTSFECPRCSNRCEVSRFEIEDRKVHFGDTCERYTSKEMERRGERRPTSMDLLAECAETLLSFGSAASSVASPEHVVQKARPQSKPVTRIGLPRASFFLWMMPFWRTLFERLGFETVVSERTSPETLEKGLKHLPAETCLPIKLAFGHLAHLTDLGVDHIFLPSMVRFPGGGPRSGLTCPYVRTLPYMARATTDMPLLTPEVDFTTGKRGLVKALAPIFKELGVAKKELQGAVEKAIAVQDAWLSWASEQGREFLHGSFDRALVLLGKPYNLLDPYCNMNLGKHLQRLGVPAIPLTYLKTSHVPLEGRLSRIYWQSNADVVRGVIETLNDPRLFPVIVTNFGCGPDAFTLTYIEELLQGKPHLVLEFDEHRGEAGLITRLEAFLDEIESYPSRAPVDTVLPVWASAKENTYEIKKSVYTGRKVFIPYYADHVFAFSGALRFGGFDTEVLDLPDDRVRLDGEAHCTGKECHAYAMILGDLIQLASRPNLSKTAFFLPGTPIPCLMHQYSDAMRMVMDRLDAKDIQLLNPEIPEMFELVGLEGCVLLYRGLLAIDLLVKAACETRPYELQSGETDSVLHDSLRQIETAMVEKKLSEVFQHALDRFGQIAVDRSEPRPVIGIAGDIYTRANAAANCDLYRLLEKMGCEVWPAPFEVDIIDFRLAWDALRGLRSGRVGEALGGGVLLARKAREIRRSRRLASGRVRHFDEPGYRGVKKLAHPYIGLGENEVLFLNMAKMTDFASKGADGVLNVVCFNCMIGTISNAISSRIRRGHGGIPMTTLVYSGTQNKERQSMLEAFVYQARRFAQRKQPNSLKV